MRTHSIFSQRNIETLQKKVTTSHRESPKFQARLDNLLQKYETAANRNGKSEDLGQRWEQIKQGLHTVRAPRDLSANNPQESVVTPPVMVEDKVSNQSKPVEAASYDRVQILRNVNYNTVVSATPAPVEVEAMVKSVERFDKPEVAAVALPDPAEHWAKLKEMLEDIRSGNGKMTLHKVEQGETLESIAEKMMGNSKKAGVIARFNNLSPDAAIPVGKTLRIPPQQTANSFVSFGGA